MKRTTIMLKLGILTTLSLGCVLACNNDDNSIVEPENRAPLANAGDDRQAELESVVKLDASGSSDPDGDALTYKWSFTSIPEGSAASIVGIGLELAEFTMDRAGNYQVQLEVSDGAIQAADSFTISNNIPIINQIRPRNTLNLDDLDIAQKGQLINIYGKFFSSILAENKVIIAGVEMPVIEMDFEDGVQRLRIEVAENAKPGKLVVTLGSQTAEWPVPLRLIHSPPVNVLIENDPDLIENERDGLQYRYIGIQFKPLVKGKLYGVGTRSVNGNENSSRLAIWKMTSETFLTSMDLSYVNENMRWRALEKPILLEAGEEYGVTFLSNDWFFYVRDPKEDIFPATIGQIEIVSTIHTQAYDDPPTTFDFPTTVLANYLSHGVDILFVPDIE